MKKAAAWLALAAALISSGEGLRTYAYRDPVGIPTICFGHTAGVKMGDTATTDQCNVLLASDLVVCSVAFTQYVKVPLNDNQRAAFCSFIYNTGTKNFARSTLLRRLNAGEYAAACNELLQWHYAGAISLPGLAERRAKERELCLSPPNS